MSDSSHIIEGEIIEKEVVSGQWSVVSAKGRATPVDCSVESTVMARVCDVQYTPIVSRRPITIREATLDDVAFIDSMQKVSTREVGWLPTKAIEGKIKRREALVAEVAEDVSRESLVVSREEATDSARFTTNDQRSTADPRSTTNDQRLTKVGYIIASDRYAKRDELGIITQINVLPDYRRSLVAAELLQAQFARSAYGCRLYCCWCAQDLKANEFWEAMGFTAIAFRTGSMTKGKDARGKKAPRVHILWEKRIRAGDEAMGFWYPSQTAGGEMRDDRIVLPIMPGVSWRDVGPILLGDGDQLRITNDELRIEDGAGVDGVRGSEREAKPSRFGVREEENDPKAEHRTPNSDLSNAEHRTPKKQAKKVVPPEKSTGLASLRFGPAKPVKAPKEKAPREKAPKEKVIIDPRLISMARELRDQWSEQTVIPSSKGKYDVKRIAQAQDLGGLKLDVKRLVA